MNPKFQIYTGLLKAFEQDGVRRLRTTASSTISDLAGDEILPPAIEQMALKAKDNMTIFLNHEYRVPEDVLGSVEGATMQTRGVDGEGSPIVDLDFDIRLNDTNPRALQTYEAIKSGTKLGTSIGAIVRHATKKKGGGLRIDDIELLEASIVGIPANPRSWVHYAMKAINQDASNVFITLGNGFPEEDLEPPTVVEEGPEEVKEPEDSGKEESTPELEETNKFMVVGEAGPETIAKIDMTAELEAAAEPDKEAGRTRVTVTVDSDAAQDAPKSNPELAVIDEDRADAPTDEATAALGDVTRAADLVIDTSDITTVIKRLTDIAKQLVDTQQALGDERAAHADTKDNLAAALQIFERIADLPVGRKTHFEKAVTDYRAKFPQYDNEFIKLLEK